MKPVVMIRLVSPQGNQLAPLVPLRLAGFFFWRLVSRGRPYLERWIVWLRYFKCISMLGPIIVCPNMITPWSATDGKPIRLTQGKTARSSLSPLRHRCAQAHRRC